MGITGAESRGALIHSLREPLNAAAVVTCQTTRDVVRAFDKQGPQKIDSRIRVAGFDVQLHRFGQSIRLCDDYWPIEVAAFGDNQSGQKFCCAGRRANLVGIFFINDLSADGVNHNHRNRTGSWDRPRDRLCRNRIVIRIAVSSRRAMGAARPWSCAGAFIRIRFRRR